MSKIHFLRPATLMLAYLLPACSLATELPVNAPCGASGGHGDPQAVVAALSKLRSALTEPQRAQMDRPLTRESAIRWSNLPIAIVKRDGLRLGDLDAAPAAAAHDLFEAALSACGVKLLDEIRLADDFLLPLDKQNIGWSGGNYYLTVLGQPSPSAPWVLQIGGHHIAYNLTFNGRQAGATPLFFGTEPIRFTLAGADYEPLTAQSTAMRNLATAIAVHPQAKLSGTFTDVVKGVVTTGVPGQLPTGGTDTGYPHTYPTGNADRGVLYSALTPAQQQLVRAALESYAALPGSAITHSLVQTYESKAALRETYVGYAGATDLGERGSYVRIDGPRIWMELVVQRAVANHSENHYHALWRDKLSDYGGEVGH